MTSASAGTAAGGSGGSGTTSTPAGLLNRARVIPAKDDDKKPLWRYVELLEKTGRGTGGNARFRCRLCNRNYNGSYSRIKAHLLRISGLGISACQKVSGQVLEQLKEEVQMAEDAAARSMPRDIPLPPDGVGSKKRKTAIEASFNQDVRTQLDCMIARLFYTAGVPFNVARNPFFRKAFMYAANNNIGGYVPPNYNKLRTTLLAQERNHVENMLQPIKTTWGSKGVTVVSDGWSDAQRRPLLNFLAVTEDGPMFLKAINTEGEIKRKEYIADQMKAVIEEIGPKNVVQIITDNAANCKAAGGIIEYKWSHIFWTPCVVHTLNLALKNICAAKSTDGEAFDGLKWITEVSNDALFIKNFIMNHSQRLFMFNSFSKLKFLAIADTRFASTVVMLKRFVAIKEALTLMVVSDKWAEYREDNQEQAQMVKEKILNDMWWDKVEYIIEFTDPIYSMIRAADTDRPCLHLCYEMWDTMIENVKKVVYRHEGKELHEFSNFYTLLHEILVSRWAKSNTPLHCLAHSLNPKYYSDSWLREVPGRVPPHEDHEISEERNKCFRKMFGQNSEELIKIKKQFADFSLFGSGFGGFDSMDDRAHLEPKQWWGIHGNCAVELRALALRLLGQPASSSCAERNWSTYGLIHSSMRNKLRPERAEDLVFVHQNLRLLSRKSEEYSCGPTRMWDVGGDSHEVFGGGADFLQDADLSLDVPELEAMIDDLNMDETDMNT